MKRWFSLCMALLMMISLTACGSKERPYTEKTITAEKLQEKTADKASFVFMVERDGCMYCKQLNAYIKKTKGEHNNITVYKLDSTDFGFQKESENSMKLISTTKDGNILLDVCPYFLYTPAVYVVKKGKVVKAGIGFNKQAATVSLGNNKSTPDLSTAENEEFWDFIENAL